MIRAANPSYTADWFRRLGLAVVMIDPEGWNNPGVYAAPSWACEIRKAIARYRRWSQETKDVVFECAVRAFLARDASWREAAMTVLALGGAPALERFLDHVPDQDGPLLEARP